MPHNVEPSAFRKGEFVAYGAGTVWNVSRTGKAGEERAYWAQVSVHHPRANNGLVGFYGRTLADIGAKLDESGS